MKDLIIQILAMVSEQREMKVNVDKRKGFKLRRKKAYIKGVLYFYSPNAKDPQKRVIYHRVVEMLEEGKAISKIAKEVNITRQTVYRIKHDKGLS